MCATCGCGDTQEVSVTKLADGTDGAGHDHHHHHHHHDHGGDHDHHHHDHGDDHHHHDHHHDADHHHHHHGNEPSAATVRLEAEILAKNREIAERNRSWLAGREVLALNLVSSPGSGKTTLLERTIRDLGGSRAIAVIEGDQATPNDGQRIRAAGAAAVQINTGTGCHLEADMVARAIGMLRPAFRSLLFIENVGNLVCPALFDLGERAKVAILSVTEGEDKPMKYPHLFQAARLVLLNKIDLLPHLDFDLDRCLACARDVNPECPVLPVSARTGEGLDRWYDWLRSEAEAGVAASA